MIWHNFNNGGAFLSLQQTFANEMIRGVCCFSRAFFISGIIIYSIKFCKVIQLLNILMFESNQKVIYFEIHILDNNIICKAKQDIQKESWKNDKL